MEYLSNNRAHNSLDKWSTHKLSFSHMYCKLIKIMILVIFFVYTVHFTVVQNVMHDYISHKGQG